jgi:arabinogalactan endo-1,4-beta-galactosidase
LGLFVRIIRGKDILFQTVVHYSYSQVLCMTYLFTVNLLLAILFCSCGKRAVKKPSSFYDWKEFVIGADMSYVNEIENAGGVYKIHNKPADPFEIVKSIGVNTVRVRLWHNPVWKLPLTGGKLYSHLYDAEKTISRAKAAGMAVNLDLHYSDTWADPAHQQTPAAWNHLSAEVLADSVYQYTLSVLKFLESKQLVPEMIQIGNETNNGMLWPLGKTNGTAGWQVFAALLNSGIKAVKDFSNTSAIRPQIILHVAQLQDAENWLHQLTNNGVTEFDILGLSHYDQWSNYHNMERLSKKIDSLQTMCKKKVMIVETAVPWTNENADGYSNILKADEKIHGVYEISTAGQQQYINDLIRQVQINKGSGVMYWEPCWISSSMKDPWGKGSAWDNATWFNFSGNLHGGFVFTK